MPPLGLAKGGIHFSRGGGGGGGVKYPAEVSLVLKLFLKMNFEVR